MFEASILSTKYKSTKTFPTFEDARNYFVDFVAENNIEFLDGIASDVYLMCDKKEKFFYLRIKKIPSWLLQQSMLNYNYKKTKGE